MNTLLQFAQESGDYYTSYTTTTIDSATSTAALSGLIVFSIIAAVIGYVISALLLGRIFKKAGVEAWIAWVPIYNSWKLLEIGGQKGFWAPLALVPFVNYVSVVFMFIAMYNIGLKLGKSGGFVVLGIFLPLVWIIWLAFDKSTWNDSLGKPSLAVSTPAPAPVTPTTTESVSTEQPTQTPPTV